MILDINLLPKKLSDINYFKKVDGGCELYSYSAKLQLRNEVIVINLPGVEIENDFCVDSRVIDMLRTLSPADITITEKNFIIKSKKGKYSGKLISENLFELSKEDLDYYTSVNLESLNKACNFTSKNDKKPVLAGVRVDNNGNVIATDSFTLYTYNYNNNEYTLDGYTLPVNFISIIKSLTTDEEVNIYHNDNVAMFKLDNIKIYTRLISGGYPDVRKLIATNGIEVVNDIDRNDIIEKVEIASKLSVLGNEEKNIQIELSNNKLVAYGEDNFESEIKLNCSGKIRVSNLLLTQALKSISDFDFKFKYDKDNKGIMLYLTNNNELCLILGIRTN